MSTDFDESVLVGLREKLGEKVVDQLVSLFFETVDQRRQALAEALGNGDAKGAGAALHSIRGSAQLVGAVRLEAIAASWEERARNEDSSALGDSLAEVNAAVDGVRRRLGAG